MVEQSEQQLPDYEVFLDEEEDQNEFSA
jgi:ATP-dependent RNA helicase UAP56/SUB2